MQNFVNTKMYAYNIQIDTGYLRKEFIVNF